MHVILAGKLDTVDISPKKFDFWKYSTFDRGFLGKISKVQH